MNYQEFINNILQVRGRFIDCNEYYERHHIVPRCKNGSDDEDNLIDLYANEHFIAHKLLAEENANDYKLVHAYTLMAFVKDKNQKRYELTPDEYEEARRLHSISLSGKNNPSAKKVIRLCDEKIYDTVKDCSIDNNICISTVRKMLKQCRKFMYYIEWENMTNDDKLIIKSIDWDEIEHKNRSDAAKKAGNGGSTSCSQATRDKISAANKGRHGIKVYCYELDQFFVSISEASHQCNVNKESIRLCIYGKQKHAGKHPVTGEQLSWVKLENKNC